jgi:raffinose/stachyose/melibiose transport system permease protein
MEKIFAVAKSIQNELGSILQFVIFMLISTLTIGPLFWIITISLKTKREFYSSPFTLPQAFRFDNYSRIINDDLVQGFFVNSVIITGLSLVLVLIFGSLAAYALAKIEFRGSTGLFFLFLMGNAVPIITVIIPLYILINRMGLGESRWGIIFPLVAMNIGITILILRGFFRTVPSDLEDAARIDGCNILQLIWYILLPVVRPGLIATAAIDFIAYWNEYYVVAVLAGKQQMMTLPAGLSAKLVNFYTTDWPGMSAGIILSVVPVVILFMIAQDRIVSGWSVQAGKQ